MLNFESKKKIFDYIKKKFRKSRLILVRGSSVNKKLKAFSDIDAEVHSDKSRKPYYEIVFVREKPILISIYFYKYRKGKIINAPDDIKIISGKYNDKIKPDFSKDTYNNKEKIKRECQLVIDFLFKYMRNKNRKDLETVQKRI